MATKTELEAELKKLKADIAKFVVVLDAAAIENDLCEEWYEVLDEATAGTGIETPARNYVVGGSVSFDFSFEVRSTSRDKAVREAQEALEEAVEDALSDIEIGEFEASCIDVDAYEAEVQ